MAKVINFPSTKPDQEVFYIKIIPDSETGPRIYVECFGDKGLVESEITVFELN